MSDFIFFAVLFGFILIPITYLAGFIAKLITQKPSLPEICSTWNEYYIMEITIFFTGILTFLLLYYTQLINYEYLIQIFYNN